jgi:hypothetical protein
MEIALALAEEKMQEIINLVLDLPTDHAGESYISTKSN